MEQTVFDTIIIGGGPGGYTAALYAARAGFSVLVLEKLSPGGQMATTDMIENYPGFPEGINGFELAMKMKQQAERFGVQTQTAEVLSCSLSGEQKELKTKKETYFARTVVLASGASPRELGLPGEKELRGRGVSYCATCDGMFYRGKTVAVIGGGNTAAADAVYLSRLCEKVFLIHRRDTLRASRSYLPLLEQAGNVEILWNTEAEKLLYDETVSGLLIRCKPTGEQRELACDGVFIAVGNDPCSALFREQVEVDSAGYVLADETTRTSLPGVFAIGDLRKKPMRQVITAAADGAVAAHFIEEYLDQLI